jgi:hypothetical protein
MQPRPRACWSNKPGPHSAKPLGFGRCVHCVQRALVWLELRLQFGNRLLVDGVLGLSQHNRLREQGNRALLTRSCGAAIRLSVSILSEG